MTKPKTTMACVGIDEEGNEIMREVGEFDVIKSEPKPMPTKPVEVDRNQLVAIYQAASKYPEKINEYETHVKNYNHAQMTTIMENGAQYLINVVECTMNQLEKISSLKKEEQEKILLDLIPRYRAGETNCIKEFFSSFKIKTSKNFAFQLLAVNESCFEAATDQYPPHKLWKKIRSYGDTQGRKFKQRWNDEKNGYDVTRVS